MAHNSRRVQIVTKKKYFALKWAAKGPEKTESLAGIATMNRPAHKKTRTDVDHIFQALFTPRIGRRFKPLSPTTAT